MRAMVSIRKRWASAMSVVVLGLLLLLPASPHGADVVLCIEESGQVNVERAESGECTEEARVKSESAPKIIDRSEREHCRNCSDVPLRVSEADDPCTAAVVSSSLELEALSGQEPLLASVSVLIRPFGTEEPPLPPYEHVQSGPSGTDRDTSLSSVVLLI